MEIREARDSDTNFIYLCLKELSDDEFFSIENFKLFVQHKKIFNKDNIKFVIGSEEGLDFGLLTCNKFFIPRYLGIGIELEEVIILPEFRGKGLVGRFIEKYFESIKKDQSVRKLIVKTDDKKIASKAYEKVFDKQDHVLFSKKVNYL
tara:strand:- start:371 stop:814 length:444 start_codon:yes stop_codon:yes gene_type:complete